MAGILAYFQRTAVFSRCIPHGEVLNDHEFFTHLDPEFRGVPFTRAEIINDLLHLSNALGRMAILHLAPNDGRRALKDTVAGL